MTSVHRPILQFILIFDRTTGALQVEQFGIARDTATARYRELELAHETDANVEIVLVGSVSLDTIRITHPHYFNGEQGKDSLTRLEEQVRSQEPA